MKDTKNTKNFYDSLVLSHFEWVNLHVSKGCHCEYSFISSIEAIAYSNYVNMRLPRYEPYGSGLTMKELDWWLKG